MADSRMSETTQSAQREACAEALLGGIAEPGSKTTALETRLAREDVRAQLFGTPSAPPRIGRFTILRPLGEGGVGRVYAAYDEQLDRRIAIKVLRHGVEDNSRIRIEREARAMAKLTHPNVVQVYEVSTAEGELYIAMEYIEGETLDVWQKSSERSWSEILSAYMQAGEGLAAAHAAGMVHRDFKPQNAMLSILESGAPRVRVLDFGLVRLLEGLPTQERDMRTGDTGPCSTLTATGKTLGTPAYMAPEQFVTNEVGEAADQFSLCVSLWEALYGTRPFSGTSTATLLQAIGAGKSPPSTTQVPTKVFRALARGLALDPNDRWPAMEVLLRALGHHEPASRKSRIWVFAASATGLAAVLGAQALVATPAERCTGAALQLQGIWDAAERADVKSSILGTQTSYAQRAWERTAASLDDYAHSWKVMHHEVCTATLRGEQSSAVMDLRMGCLRRAKVTFAAATSVLSRADKSIVARAGRVVDSIVNLERCENVAALKAGVEAPRRKDAEAVLSARDRLADANAAINAGLYTEARDLVEVAALVVQGIDYEPIQIELGLRKGSVLDGLGEYEAAEDALVATLDLAVERGQLPEIQEAASTLMSVVGQRQQRSEEALWRYRLLAEGWGSAVAQPIPSNVGPVLQLLGKYDEAEAENRRALARLESTLSADHPEVARARGNLANILLRQGHYEQAETHYRGALAALQTTLGPKHPDVASCRINLSVLLQTSGKYEESEAEYRRVLALEEETLGPDHPTTIKARLNIANAQMLQGKYKLAEAGYRRALPTLKKALGPEHPTVASARANLAVSLFSQGHYAAAESEHHRVLALLKKILPANHPNVGAAHANLGSALYEQGKYVAAETEYRRALALDQHNFGSDHRNVGQSMGNVAVALYSQGKYQVAETQNRIALAILEKSLGPKHPEVADSRTNLALVLLERNNYPEAESEMRLALAINIEQLGAKHPNVVLARSNLGQVLHAQQRRDQAVLELRQAVSVGTEVLAPNHPTLATAQSNLAVVLLELEQVDEALVLAQQAWQRRKRDDIPPKEQADTAFVLAKALWQANPDGTSRSRARTLAQLGLKAYRAAGVPVDKEVAAVERWLRRRGAR